MTDRGPCTRVELDGRRVVVDLSDADLAQLSSAADQRGLDGSALVLGWIRYGLVSNRPWDEPGNRTDQARRVARDAAVAQQTTDLFRDLLGDQRDPD